jgi:hypothetical protein
MDSTEIKKLNYFSDEKIYEKQLLINNNTFTKFLNKQYEIFKEKHSASGLYSEDHIKQGIVYDPGAYMEHYNVFDIYSADIYNILDSVKELLSLACFEYGIDIKKQQYMIHGWFNYFPIKMYNERNYDELCWHDHGQRLNAFHGYYAVNAEPSITHYKINGEKIDRENKNGRLILAKTGIPHAVGRWNEESPRITVAYNVSTLKDVIAAEETGFTEGPFIPLCF